MQSHSAGFVANSNQHIKLNRYILTGTPGSGKTVLIRALEMRGYNVVDEAATDVIQLEQAYGNPTPWTKPDFIENVTRLQIQRRQVFAKLNDNIQFFDRSPFCTLALAEYLGYPPPKMLLDEIEAIQKQQIYQNKLFFIENLGHCVESAARKITFEEALRFEKIHQAVYHAHGFTLINIPNQSILDRVQTILSAAFIREKLNSSHITKK